jgi:hypothetical protein
MRGEEGVFSRRGRFVVEGMAWAEGTKADTDGEEWGDGDGQGSGFEAGESQEVEGGWRGALDETDGKEESTRMDSGRGSLAGASECSVSGFRLRGLKGDRGRPWGASMGRMGGIGEK